ncbi:MAG: hypothetical protein KZQ96_21665 [Candidatus Thiodiazotropha sp. (ex Lucinoma borealis)]|nr:hypothetical protein [Candidatus Thiodiazotropha sp. (ex Lucinoma borealis)]
MKTLAKVFFLSSFALLILVGIPACSDHSDGDCCNGLTTTGPSAATKGEHVSMNADLSGSIDSSIVYSWQQVSGTNVTLVDAKTSNPSFVVPSDVIVGETLTFQATATTLLVEYNEEISISIVALPQHVTASGPANVHSGDVVHLHATPGITPAAGATYLWTQDAGTSAVLNDLMTNNPYFTAPAVSSDEDLHFLVTLNSDGTTYSSSVTVKVHPAATRTLTTEFLNVSPGHLVSLHVQGSVPSGTTVHWVQTTGNNVTLTGATTTNPTFTAPANGGILKFAATFTNALGGQSTSHSTVTVAHPTANTNHYKLTAQPPTIRVPAGDSVTLAVTEANGTAQTVTWSQRSSDTSLVMLSNDGTLTPSFTVPSVTNKEELHFTVTAVDTVGEIASTIILVEIYPATHLQISTKDVTAYSGDNQSLDVYLNQAVGSVSYLWEELSNTGITVDNATSQRANFVVPANTSNLQFRVTVTDDIGSQSDTIDVKVVTMEVLAGPDEVVYIGDTASLFSIVTGAKKPVSFQWSKSSGTSQTIIDNDQSIASITPTVAGKYLAVITATDSVPVANSDQMQIEAIAQPTPLAPVTPPLAAILTISPSPSQKTFEGRLVTLSVSTANSAGAITYQWTQTAGTSVILNGATTATTTFTAPAVTGDEHLAFEIEVDDGVTQQSAKVLITVQDKPLHASSPNSTALAYSPTHVSATVFGGVPSYTYAWTQVSGPSVTLTPTDKATANFTPIQAGVYVFELNITDSLPGTPNTTSSRETVTVSAAPTAPAIFNSPQIPFIAFMNGGSTTYEGNTVQPYIKTFGTVGPVTYAWSETSSLGVTINNANQRQASITLPDVTADTQLDLQVVVDDSSNQPQTLNVSYHIIDRVIAANAGSDVTMDANQVVHLYGFPSGSSFTYAWTQISGATVTLSDANTDNPSFTPTTAGSYVFQLSVLDSLSSSTTDTVNVTVLDTLNVDAGASTTVNSGDNVSLHPTLTGLSSVGPVTYKWTADRSVTFDASPNSAADANAHFTYSPSSTEKVILTLQVDDAGHSTPETASDTVAVTFNVAQTILGTPVPPCQGKAVEYNSSGTPTGNCIDPNQLSLPTDSSSPVAPCGDQKTAGRVVPPGNFQFSAWQCGTGNQYNPIPSIACALAASSPTLASYPKCAVGELPWIRVNNSSSGDKEYSMGCKSTAYCKTNWWQGTSDDDKCRKLLTGTVLTYAFECEYCCVGDNCNSVMESQIRGGSNNQCPVLPGTLALF